jgi:hypothetical protein
MVAVFVRPYAVYGMVGSLTSKGVNREGVNRDSTTIHDLELSCESHFELVCLTATNIPPNFSLGNNLIIDVKARRRSNLG